MNLATWSIRNPTPSILIFVLLTIAGIWGFKRLNIQDLPDLDLPTVKAELRLPGAAPAQLETEVARKVENSMATLLGLKHIKTQINEGAVIITASFALERNLSEALIDVKDSIDKIRNDLPSDLEEPKISKVMIGPGGAIVTYAISSTTRSEEELSWLVDDTVAKRVQSVPGIGDFRRVGGVQREINVEVNPAQLIAFGATAADVSRALQRVQQEASGGRGQLGQYEQGVRTLATVNTADELNATPIVLNNGVSIPLGHIAQIRDDIADRTQAALLNGKSVVGFQVWRSKGFDETRIAAAIAQAMQKLQSEQPDLQIQLISSTVGHTLEQFDGSMDMLYEGAVLSVLVIFLFLRDWRATIIGAIALPLSIIPSFAFMAWMGYSLNTITLLALAVVVGILVDDAIVEVENISRHMRSGKPVRQATEEAVNEIALAVLATTCALLVVFLPTAFMRGVPGLVFSQFGWTIVVSVLLSFLVARIITPMMAVALVKSAHEEEADGRMMRFYLRMIHWSLDNRTKTMAIAAAFLGFTALLFPHLPTGFIPPADRGYTTIEVELPAGSRLEDTMAMTEAVRHAISDIAAVESVFSSAGDSTRTEGGEVRNASIVVVLAERKQRGSQISIENQIRERLSHIAGARFSLRGGGSGEKIELVIAGTQEHALNKSAYAIEQELKQFPFLRNVTSTARLERQEIQIIPDPVRSAERGVTTQAIADTLRVALSGDRKAALSKLNLDERQIDIRVTMPKTMRGNLNAIAALHVPGRFGLVTLGSIADIRVGSAATQLNRYDRERQVTITADLAGSALGDALKATHNLVSVKQMPASVHLIESGDAETQAELFGGMSMAMLTAVICLYGVLVLLFDDWMQPITILSAVPLSVGGAFLALLATDGQLNLPSLIGLVMLMGIVTKNSILVVDFAIVAIKSGMTERDALIDACHKRAQPILMTSVAMAVGMMPLALGFGADASFRQPMAITVIGGLVSATLMSLIVVPVVYTYVSQFEHWSQRFWQNMARAISFSKQ